MHRHRRMISKNKIDFENILNVPVDEGRSKVVSIEQAIRENVKPGMIVHVAPDAGAALREIVRLFWGTGSQITLVIAFTSGIYVSCMVHGGIIEKLIFSNCADFYPKTRLDPIIQAAYKNNTIELENWSTLSYYLRLMAGALGTHFMPTVSLVGSSLVQDNDFVKIGKDPFGSGEEVALVKALRPDISIVHGWAADGYGNTITAPFSLEVNTWGAKASRDGVIVTVEEQVSTQYIRQHSPSVKIPGHLVKAVSVTPKGAHPLGLSAQGLENFEGYRQDNDFLAAGLRAKKDPEELDKWVERWVVGCPTHRDFLQNIEDFRSSNKKKKSVNNTLNAEQTSRLRQRRNNDTISPKDMMVIAASRKITERIIKKGCRVLFGGVGYASIAASLAYYLLKEKSYDVDMFLAGLGCAPKPGALESTNLETAETAKYFPDAIDFHGAFVSGANNSCLGVLGAAEIDKYGNVNSTILSSGYYLGGAGGANDMASGAKDLVAIVAQTADRFVDKVFYISSVGKRVSTLISDKGVYEKISEGGQFILTEYFPSSQFDSEEDILSEIIDQCGWNLEISPAVKQSSRPSSTELAMLRLLNQKDSV